MNFNRRGEIKHMNNTRDELDELKTEMRKLHKKVEAIASESEPLLDKAADVYGRIKEQIKDQVDDTLQSTQKAREDVNEYMKENPWQIALVSLGVVLLAGWLAARRKD